MISTRAAEGFYRVKDRLRFLRGLVPQAWRKALFAAVVNRAIARLPSRTYIADTIVPALGRAGCRKMLFVGAQSYNRALYRLCAEHGLSVRSIDRDPQAARFGAPEGHYVGDIRDVARLAPGAAFDCVIFNGVLGFGIDTAADADAVIDALAAVSASGAWLVVGWNPGRTDDGEILAFRRRLAPATLPGLDHACEFPVHGRVQPYPHRYETFRLHSRPA
jgi:hypothetical protein